GGPPLIGILADRVGLRRILALVYGLGTISFIVILLFPAYMTLTILLILAGASVGALYPLAVGLIGEVLSSSELPRGNAMTTFAYGIGSIIGPLFPALIMHVTVPKSLFVISAILYIIVLVVMGVQKRS
ncbi:MAG: MFS transporter, partial [Deltaproteobacteria bacterium]|nr:MFS transporter [Deltaproteobacteria bacterium]